MLIDEHLLFDARELITNIRRGLAEGIYDDVVEPKSLIPEGLSEFLITILDKYKESEKTTSTTSLSFNLSHIDTSFDEPGDYTLSEMRSSMMRKRLLEERIPKKKQQQTKKPEQILYVTNPAVVPALANALANDHDESVKIAAAMAIGELGIPSAITAVPSLCSSLRDKSNKVRAACAVALGKLGPTVANEAVGHLVQLLRDSHWNVRHTTLLSLRKFGAKAAPAVPALEKVLFILYN